MDIQKCPLNHEEKRNMIAEIAFFKFENRGYAGDPIKDWLEAETELEDALATFCRSSDQAQEVSAYRRIRHELQEKGTQTFHGWFRRWRNKQDR